MRFVVKAGTSLITNEKHELDRDFLEHLTAQIAGLCKEGHQVILVTSGAVAAGRPEIKFEREKKAIPFRQALAAIGQGMLMETYRGLFAKYKIPVAQALLTNHDFVNRENFLNAKNIFELLTNEGAVPIVNENDVTTMADSCFSDNDMLSAQTAAMVSADCLIILTDVDGLFKEDPKKYPDAKMIPVVTKVDDLIKKMAGGARSKHSSGGMITKVQAAEYVTSVGISMFIAHGRRKNILKQLAEFCIQCGGDDPKGSEKFCSTCTVGTFFPPSAKRAENQKKWLRPKISKNAWIEIDPGAVTALMEHGKSLLPSGINLVHGTFKRGDVITVRAGKKDVCYGQVNYGSVDLEKIKKQKSTDIERILGFSFEEEVIHRDRMVMSE